MSLHLARDGQTLGPFTDEELRARLASGEASASDLAWTDGMPDWRPLHEVRPDLVPAPAAPAPPPPPSEAPPPVAAVSGFHHVAVWKFCLLSVVTFGLYVLYWTYRNWRAVREMSGRTEIWPFWRAMFAPLWMFPLGKHIAATTGRLQEGTAIAAGVGYLGFQVAERLLPGSWGLVAVASFLPLLPLVVAIDRDHRARGLRGRDYSRLGPASWVAGILGCGLWAVVIAGLLAPTATVEVVRGEALRASDVRWMRDRQILESREQPLFFYSDGLWSIHGDGNLLTDRHVVSYYEDADGLVLERAAFDEIAAVRVVHSTGTLEDTWVEVEVDGGRRFRLMFSAVEGGDRPALDELRSRWQAARPGVDLEVVEALDDAGDAGDAGGNPDAEPAPEPEPVTGTATPESEAR